MRRTGAGGKTHRACGHGFFHQCGHGVDFFGRGLTFIRLLAHHPCAHRGVAYISGNIDGAAFLLEHGHVFREGLKIPIDALLQNIKGHALHLGEVAHGQLTVLGTTGCDGEATVANDRGGDAHGRRGTHIGVPSDLGIKMGM